MARPSAPVVSVVIATHNRRALLGRLLDAIEVQGAVGPFEVVVVDDASSDDTAAFLTARAESDPSFTLTVLRQTRNQGPAAARNRGWRTATAPVVCFTDDDCIPEKGWLQAHLAAVASGADIVQGRTIPVPDQRDRWTPFSRSITRERDGGFYETCNMSYRREVLERTGGFDEDFRFPYGEDTDLAWRAIHLGHQIVFCSAAEVHHEVWPFDWKAHLADLRRREGMVLLVRKHPQLRTLFPAPWVEHRRHTSALATAGSLVAVAARPRSAARWAVLAGSIGHFYSVSKLTRLGPRRRRHWPGYLPLLLVSDLSEVAVMAAASVKHRTLLL